MHLAATIACVLAIAAPAGAGEAITPAQVQHWSAVFAGGAELGRVLTEFQRGPKEPWPAVVSSEYASPLSSDARARHATFRAFALQLTRTLESDTQRLSTLVDTALIEHATRLLVVRDYLRARPSYVNWVLTDTLTRIVFVSVSKRLVKANTLVAPIAALVEPLGRWSLDLDTFRTIAEAELGHELSAETLATTPEATSDREPQPYWNAKQEQRARLDRDTAREARRATLLMKQIEPQSLGLLVLNPEKLGKADTYDLLKGRYLEFLLFRYLITDMWVHGALPRVLRYAQLAGGVSLDTPYRQIADRLEKELLPMTVVEWTAGQRNPRLLAEKVVELFRWVKDGEIDKELRFNSTS